MRKLQIFLALIALAGMPVVAAAQDSGSVDFEHRMELARKFQGIRPAGEQIDRAIEQYAATLPQMERDEFTRAMRKALNYKALEKISVDAYAETFTAEELEVLIEYHSRPEVRSALEKLDDYNQIVYPEIIRMLDKALMSVKTGASP